MNLLASLGCATAGVLFALFALSTWCVLKDIAPLGSKDRRIGWMLLGGSVAVSLTLFATAAFAEVPHQARQYRPLLIRTAHYEMGLSAPVSTFAAQITQESFWNPNAKSGVGASGLAQFMPATANWMGDIDKRLAPAKVFNPGWAMRAMITYDLWLLKRVDAVDACNGWAFALSAYNGGLGWVYRDKRLAVANNVSNRLYWGGVERFNAGRSAGNFKQNRDYPVRILQRWEPKFVAAGWGAGVCTTHDWGQV